jgi:hypothetical protein
MTGRKAIPDGSRENAASRCYRFVNTAIRPPPAPSTQSNEIVNACQIADLLLEGPRASRDSINFATFARRADSTSRTTRLACYARFLV